MKPRYQEAFDLANARIAELNSKGEEVKPIQKKDIALKAYPTKPAEHSQVYINTQFKADKKTIHWPLFEAVCESCQVDPNFLLGWPSVHDQDYNRLILDTLTD